VIFLLNKQNVGRSKFIVHGGDQVFMENGINKDSGQKINRILIMKILKSRVLCSKADLARMVHLQPATITNIINELKDVHLVKEEGTINEGRGRKGIAVSIDNSYYKVIGIRLSRKYFLIGLFDLTGNELNSSVHGFEQSETPKEMFDKVKTQIKKLMQQTSDSKIVGIGCAIPGPFFRKNGLETVGSEFPDWNNIQIKRELEEQFGVLTFLEHDANVGALAFQWELGVDPKKILVYFSVGQGVGAGIVSGESLVLGALGAAGEVGHMTIESKGVLCQCGNYGCLEKYCSSVVLTNIINEKIAAGNYSKLSKNCTFEEVSQAVKAGDKLAVYEYRNACDYLGIGVVNIVNLLNPNIVVIGDEMADVAPEIMSERVNNIVRERVNPMIWNHMDIHIGNEKTDMILKGAAIVAIDELFKDPIAFTMVDPI